MNHQEICSECGHKVTAYSHRLNKPLVNALRQLVDFYENKHKGANLQKDLNLTKNTYNNFQKLQYFGLVKRIDGTGSGWFPTESGIDFIYGRKSCYDTVMTLGKKILSPFDPLWSEKKTIPQLIMVMEMDIFAYKKREDYQAEKSDQIKLC